LFTWLSFGSAQPSKVAQFSVGANSGDHLDVVRLLGERQDIAAILGDEFAAN
jgi:hypothetical protein